MRRISAFLFLSEKWEKIKRIKCMIKKVTIFTFAYAHTRGRCYMAKYEQWLTEEGLIKLQGYARDGMVNREIAEAMGISRQTLDKWMKKFPQMGAVMKCGKEVADRKVENALYERCTGKIVRLKKPFKVKRTEYDEKTGKKVKEYEELVDAEQEEYIPADTKAIQFWLINRKPEKWKQKVEIETKEDGESSGIIEIEQVANEEILDGQYKEIETEEDE